MEEYRSNSYKTKELQSQQNSEKKVEKIIAGSAKTKKKNGLRKFTNAIIPEDVEDVKSYIFQDIVIPAVKDIILDAVRAFLGVNGSSSRNRNGGSKISYRKYYDDRERRDGSSVVRSRIGYEFDDIVVETRGEAEEVLIKMDELIATYKVVRVADFYDLVGISSSYTDNNYGWTDIKSATVVHVREGYMIKLPKALALD